RIWCLKRCQIIWISAEFWRKSAEEKENTGANRLCDVIGKTLIAPAWDLMSTSAAEWGRRAGIQHDKFPSARRICSPGAQRIQGERPRGQPLWFKEYNSWQEPICF